jgi:hypothetical protein
MDELSMGMSHDFEVAIEEGNLRARGVGNLRAESKLNRDTEGQDKNSGARSASR